MQNLLFNYVMIDRGVMINKIQLCQEVRLG